MDTHATTPSTSTHLAETVRIMLEQPERQGLRIVILPSRAWQEGVPNPLASIPEDDLANATWEDAEWR